jgi:hypothetical protein
MPDVSGMEDDAKKLASEHPDIADKGVDEAGKVAEDKTGGRFDSQIDQGEQKAEGFLGSDSQGGQDQQSGN